MVDQPVGIVSPPFVGIYTNRMLPQYPPEQIAKHQGYDIPKKDR